MVWVVAHAAESTKSVHDGLAECRFLLTKGKEGS